MLEDDAPTTEVLPMVSNLNRRVDVAIAKVEGANHKGSGVIIFTAASVGTLADRLKLLSDVLSYNGVEIVSVVLAPHPYDSYVVITRIKK